MRFSEVAGQAKLKNKLCASVHEGRVAHAQMFVGKVGTGALPLALAYAQYLSCTDRQEEDSCGKCNSCKRYEKLEHPDLQLIFPKNKTKGVSGDTLSSKNFVSQWRAAVISDPYLSLNKWLKGIGIENKQGLINVNDSLEIVQNLKFKVYESEYRVVLIWLAEHINVAAANKLLKILEEPPERTIFLLTAEDTENMLATILSRVQAHRMERLTEEQIAQELSRSDGTGKAQLDKIAYLADGDLTLAKDLLENKEHVVESVTFFIEWMRACYARNTVELQNLVDEFRALGRERQKERLSACLVILRKVLIYGVLPETKNKLLEEELKFVVGFSRFISSQNAPQILSAINDAYSDIERNANPQIVFTDVSLLMSDLLNTATPV